MYNEIDKVNFTFAKRYISDVLHLSVENSLPWKTPNEATYHVWLTVAFVFSLVPLSPFTFFSTRIIFL